MTPRPLPQSTARATIEALQERLDTLLADGDVSAFFYALVRQAAGSLDVAAAALMLTDRLGRLRFAASSDNQRSLVELFHLQIYRQSPCLECIIGGESVTASPLARFRSRWPSFVAPAEMLGFHAAHALPIRLPDVTVGVLSLLRHQSAPLSAEGLALAGAVADTAAMGLRQQQLLSRAESVVEEVHTALDGLAAIEQAKGILAQRNKLDIDVATGLLHDYAQAHHLRLSDLARRVVTDTAWAVLVARGLQADER